VSQGPGRRRGERYITRADYGKAQGEEGKKNKVVSKKNGCKIV